MNYMAPTTSHMRESVKTQLGRRARGTWDGVTSSDPNSLFYHLPHLDTEEEDEEKRTLPHFANGIAALDWD